MFTFPALRTYFTELYYLTTLPSTVPFAIYIQAGIILIAGFFSSTQLFFTSAAFHIFYQKSKEKVNPPDLLPTAVFWPSYLTFASALKIVDNI